jgi:alanyl-tRNA synthetase
VGHEEPVIVVLDRTPFYAEAGGQVGDTGMLEGAECQFAVHDTQRHGGFILHKGHLRRGMLRAGDRLTAAVDQGRRRGIQRAHSATHLLHHALRTVLGSHATQRGSKVDDDWLRFDFAQPKAITSEQLAAIEDLINARVVEGAAVTTAQMDLSEARKSGAMALFGEKYAEIVRVVTMGDFSRELCGGTHLTNTGQIGLCKIVAEESIAAGTRRITALTGLKALAKIREDEALLARAAEAARATRVEELPQRIEALAEELKNAKRELARLSSQRAAGMVEELLSGAVELPGAKVVTHHRDDWDAEAMRAQIDELRRAGSALAVMFGSAAEGKVILVAALGKDLVERGLSAAEWVKAAAKAVGGGGGGRPDLAQAGGKNPAKIQQALGDAVEYLRQKLSA